MSEDKQSRLVTILKEASNAFFSEREMMLGSNSADEFLHVSELSDDIVRHLGTLGMALRIVDRARDKGEPIELCNTAVYIEHKVAKQLYDFYVISLTDKLPSSAYNHEYLECCGRICEYAALTVKAKGEE